MVSGSQPRKLPMTARAYSEGGLVDEDGCDGVFAVGAVEFPALADEAVVIEVHAEPLVVLFDFVFNFLTQHLSPY